MPIADLQHKVQTGLRRKLWRTLFAAFLSLAVSSCGGSEPRVSGKSQVRVDVDWSGCADRVPQGMTILFHHQESGSVTSVIDNNVAYATTFLSPGRYRATVFNLTGNEFDNIRFRGLGSADTAEAYLREAAPSKWHTAPSGDGGYVAGQPEWLAADTILTPCVAAPAPTGAGSTIQIAGTLHPRTLTRNLHLILHAGNINNLRSARGALSGLAAGHRLAADVPNDNSVTVTHLIESDSWKRLPESTEMGTVEADIRCFGLPAGHNASPEENYLTFQALLADGKTVSEYIIPAGHLIRSTAGGLSLELWLDPPLPPRNDGGGIDVWFDDWDETIDFNTKL